MGLFSSARSRRAKRAAPAETSNGNGAAPDHVAPATPRPTPVTGKSLRESIQQLYSIRPSRDVFAEEVVKILAKAAGVKAAALLGYESRGGRVRLLATTGLDREVIQVLSGDGTTSAWDIPVRSIRNRRISVIEAAHENPFVPRVIAAISPRRLTIAALPFYHANSPIGVVVLFSPTQRGFADGLLHQLSQALRGCALALAELPSSPTAESAHVVEPQAHEQQPNLLRGLAALKNELARLTQALEDTERQRAAEAAERVTAQSFLQAAREKHALLEEEAADLRSQLEHLPALQGQIQDLNQRLADAVDAGEAERARVAKLQAQIEQIEQRAEGEAGAVSALRSARDELQEQLDVALEAARERNEAVEALEQRVSELTPRAARADELEEEIAAAEQRRERLGAELAKIREQLAEAQRGSETRHAALGETAAGLEAARREVDSLAAELGEARRRIEELSGAELALAAARAEVDSITAERQRLLEELQQARAGLDEAGARQVAESAQWEDRSRQLEAERTELREQIARLQAEAAETIGQLESGAESSIRERVELQARIRELEGVEADRERLRARLEEAEEGLLTAQEANRDLEGRIEEHGQVSSRLIAERKELHERIERLAAGGQTIEQEKQAAINTAERRVTEVEAELSRLAATLESVRASAADELRRARAEAETALDAARGQLAEAMEEGESLRRALEREQERSATQQGSLGEVGAERKRLQKNLDALTAERDKLGKRLEASSAEVERLQRSGAEAEKTIGSLEQQLQASREELLAQAEKRLTDAEREHKAALAQLAEQHGAEIRAVEARLEETRADLEADLESVCRERDRLTEMLAEKELLLRSAEQGLTTFEISDSESDADDSILDIDRSAAPEQEGESEWTAEEGDEEPEPVTEILLLDDGEIGANTSRALGDFGHHVTALAPVPESLGRLKEQSFACTAINLAIPTSWSTLRGMRAGGDSPRLPIIGYALAAGAPRGFWLGAVDFTILPVDACDLAADLNRLMPRVRRVIAMSNDIDVMSDVRTQLTAAKISTAVVLDGRQALDLVSTVRPEAAVLHLSPSCVDVFRAIAGLRSSEIGREIPILFLLDSEPQPREEAFLSAGIRMLSGRGNLPAEQLIDSLASALNPYCGMGSEEEISAADDGLRNRLSAARDS